MAKYTKILLVMKADGQINKEVLFLGAALLFLCRQEASPVRRTERAERGQTIMAYGEMAVYYESIADA